MLQEFICHQPEGVHQAKALQEILPFPSEAQSRGQRSGDNLLSSPPAALCFERHSTMKPGQRSLQAKPAVLSLTAVLTKGFKRTLSTTAELDSW